MDGGNENYENEMTKRKDFPFTCFPLAFLLYGILWMSMDGSLAAEFHGSEFVLIKVGGVVLNSVSKKILFVLKLHFQYRLLLLTFNECHALADSVNCSLSIIQLEQAPNKMLMHP